MNQTAHLKLNLSGTLAGLNTVTARLRLTLNNYNAALESARNYAEDLVLVLEKSHTEKENAGASEQELAPLLQEITELNAFLDDKGHLPITPPKFVRMGQSNDPIYEGPRLTSPLHPGQE